MTRRKTNPRAASRNPLDSFFRKPLVQFGIVAVAILAIAALAFMGNSAPQNGMPATMSVLDAHNLYGQSDVFFLDVRQPEEWNEFHAPNTTLIPLGELQARVNEIPKDKKIVVVCRSGNRSDEGRDILLRAGFTNVTSMDGGLNQWRQDGYPVVSGP